MEEHNNPGTPSAETSFAVILEKLKNIMHGMDDIKAEQRRTREDLEKKYVTNKDLKILKAIVYGFAGLILTGAGTALVKLIMVS